MSVIEKEQNSYKLRTLRFSDVQVRDGYGSFVSHFFVRCYV